MSYSLSASNPRVSAWADVWESDVNETNNTSIVHINVYLRRENNGYTTSGTINTTVNVDGSSKSNNGLKFSNSGTTNTQIFSNTFTVSHADDGSKSVRITISSTTNINLTISGDFWVTLTTIARKSIPTLSKTTFNIGETITIYTNRKSSSFTHTITCAFRGGNVVLAQNVATSYSWNTGNTLYSLITDAQSSWGRIILDTYSGSTKIGSNEIRFDCSVINSNPTFDSCSFEQTNSTVLELLSNDTTGIIQNCSSISVKFTGATGKNSASIKNYCVEHDGKLFTSTSNVVIVNSITNNSGLKCYVTDTRGFSSTTTTLSFGEYYEYTAPIFSNAQVVRVNDVESTVTTKFHIDISNIIIKNGATVLKYKYKDVTSTDYSDWTIVTSPTSASQDYNFNLSQLFDVDSNFNIVLCVEDNFSVVQVSLLLQTAKPELSIRKNMVGINCVPTTDNGTSLQIDGLPVIDFIVEQGTSGIWTYRKWNSGVAECWGTTSEITVTGCESWGSIYIADGVIPEQTYPFNFIEIPKCTITPKLISYNFWIYPFKKGTVSNTGKYSIARGTDASNFAIQADLYVIGKWE